MKKQQTSKLFPNDGLVYLSPEFNNMRDRIKKQKEWKIKKDLFIPLEKAIKRANNFF